MSDHTQSALDAAIHAHAADILPGALVGGWVVVIGTISPNDGDSGALAAIPPGQPVYTTAGLLVHMTPEDIYEARDES